jgi:hypothetical protein
MVSTAVRVVPRPVAVIVAVRVQPTHTKRKQKKLPINWGAAQKAILTISVSWSVLRYACIPLIQNENKKTPHNLGSSSKSNLDYKRVMVSTAVRVHPADSKRKQKNFP